MWARTKYKIDGLYQFWTFWNYWTFWTFSCTVTMQHFTFSWTQKMCRTSNTRECEKTLNFHEHETCAKVQKCWNVLKFELRTFHEHRKVVHEMMRWWVDKLVAGLIHLIHFSLSVDTEDVPNFELRTQENVKNSKFSWTRNMCKRAECECAEIWTVPKFELRTFHEHRTQNTEKWYTRWWWVDKLVADLIHNKYTSKVNSCQDAKQELTECLLKSLCGQTLQLIYYWRDYLPKDELPQPLGLNLLRVPQDHQQITWLNSQTKMVLIQVWTCLGGADQQRLIDVTIHKFTTESKIFKCWLWTWTIEGFFNFNFNFNSMYYGLFWG
jgi:hypothetical protein